MTDRLLPSDIAFTAWLATLDPARVQAEQSAPLARIRIRQAERLTPAEIALIRRTA